ncbi:MAG: hypothetical protein AAGK17_09095 [Pseudomonadota bacterium]
MRSNRAAFPLLIVCHVVLALLALLIVVFFPQPDEDVVLVPIHSVGLADAFSWTHDNRAIVKSTVAWPSGATMLVVSYPDDGRISGVFERGFIPIAAAPALCGQSPSIGLLQNA